MKPHKTISMFLISACLLSAAGGLAFAGALGQLEDANKYASGVIDGSIPKPTVVESTPDRSDADSDRKKILNEKKETEKTEKEAKAPPSVSTSTAVTPPPEPPKPTLLEKMGKDLNKNKMSYAVAGGAGALTGYFLAGCAMSGVLPGFGIVVLFLLLLRNV